MYDFLLFLIALIALPNLLYQMCFHKKYRNCLKQRFGISFPKIEKGSKKLIWVHAVSVGEASAVASLARQLKNVSDDALIIFSTITETGLKEGKKSFPEADYHVFLPFDFSYIINPIIKRIKPDHIILCETDYWYNFLRYSKIEGARITVVNGKISERSLKRFLTFQSFADKIFSQIDLFCVQSPHYRSRFLELGVPEEKIVVTGNLKFDSDFPRLSEDALTGFRKKLGVIPGEDILVAGSTHDPEEKIILDACKQAWKGGFRFKLLIVPRHPERFNEVAHLLKRSRVEFSRYSEQNSRQMPVVLVDAMGVLKQCYQLATLAIVAGSYTQKVGGHNIVEPCGYGVPVIFGPYLHSQPELLEIVTEYRAGWQIEPQNLAHAIMTLLKDPDQRHKLGHAGTSLVKDLQGATQRTLNHLQTYLENDV